MWLNGTEVEQLQNALCGAFPNQASLRRMVRVVLDQNLNDIAEGENHSERVFRLIGWAEAQGRLDELVFGASVQNRRHPKLRNFVRQLRETMSAEPLPRTGRVPSVPYAPTLFYLQRQEVQKQLDDAFWPIPATSSNYPQALTGLGGVGKTQIALDYVRRQEGKYRYIFWVYAQNEDTLQTDLREITRRLSLSNIEDTDVRQTAHAVNTWLQTNSDWLLILDNVEDLSMLHTYFPHPLSGHMLLTTRAKTTGSFAAALHVQSMQEQEGALLLLRRAGTIGRFQPFTAAKAHAQKAALAITREMGGLPLALDQAGAYIEESSLSPARYFTAYRDPRRKLLAHRGNLADQNHLSVTETFSRAFEKLREASREAADLAMCCAFLAPDPIPEEIFLRGGKELGDNLARVVGNDPAWDETVTNACRDSLLTREIDSNPQAASFHMHCLVQAVLRELPDASGWQERVLQAVETCFRDAKTDDWSLLERLLPHARMCAQRIGKLEKVAPHTAHYLKEKAKFSREKFLEIVFGPRREQRR